MRSFLFPARFGYAVCVCGSRAGCGLIDKKIPRSIFMSQDIRSYDIKNRPVLANRTKYTRCTTYYCILTYEFPLTVENRADLLAQGLPGRSDASLGVIFHLHPAPGFHHPRLALAFPQIYCLRHRLFLCVTPFYYTDHAKKCQDFDRQINQLFTGSTHRQLRPGSHRESPPTPAWPLPGLRLSLCGSNTSCRRSHAIPYTCLLYTSPSPRDA